jgi:hypothetical protein
VGIDWGALLQGTITGARSIHEGRAEQRKLEQQALRQALMDRLTQAQIGNFESLAAERLKPPVVPPTRLSPMTDPVTGDVSGYNPITNTLTPSGGRLHVKPPAEAAAAGLLRQKASAGARTAIESIDHAEGLIASDPNADVLPLGAALARGAKTSGGMIGAIAGAAEPLAQKSMTSHQQQFQADMQRMVHSMVGLLPGSRQSIVLFNSLVNAYTPQPGEAAETRTAKREARSRAREWLRAVERGEKIPLLPELVAAGITPADIESDGVDEEGAPADVFPSPAPSAAPQAPPAPRVNPRWWRQKP